MSSQHPGDVLKTNLLTNTYLTISVVLSYAAWVCHVSLDPFHLNFFSLKYQNQVETFLGPFLASNLHHINWYSIVISILLLLAFKIWQSKIQQILPFSIPYRYRVYFFCNSEVG